MVMLLKGKVLQERRKWICGRDTADNKSQGIKCGGNAVKLKHIVYRKTWHNHGSHGESNDWICDSVK